MKRWQIRLKLRWEFLLLRLGLKTPSKAEQDILSWFLKRGWRYGGIYHGAPDDVIAIIEEEYENLKKIKKIRGD